MENNVLPSLEDQFPALDFIPVPHSAPLRSATFATENRLGPEIMVFRAREEIIISTRGWKTVLSVTRRFPVTRRRRGTGTKLRDERQFVIRVDNTFYAIPPKKLLIPSLSLLKKKIQFFVSSRYQ